MAAKQLMDGMTEGWWEGLCEVCAGARPGGATRIRREIMVLGSASACQQRVTAAAHRDGMRFYLCQKLPREALESSPDLDGD